MTSTDETTVQGFSRSERSCGHGGRWSALNIAATVIGFIVFWPIGLIILGWVLSGRSVRELFHLVRAKVAHLLPGRERDIGARFRGDLSDNEVFNEFQQTQQDRIQEIRDEISGRAERFRSYRAEAKRRADREEFERFMSDAPASNGS